MTLFKFFLHNASQIITNTLFKQSLMYDRLTSTLLKYHHCANLLTYSVIVFFGKVGKSVNSLLLQSTSKPFTPVGLKHLQLRGHFLGFGFVCALTQHSSTALKASNGKILNIIKVGVVQYTLYAVVNEINNSLQTIFRFVYF